VELIAALVLITLGGVVQGSAGFGFSFTTVPALLLIHPAALPATALLLALPMVAVLAYRERHAVDFTGFGSISVGRVFGTVAGVWLLKTIPAGSLSATVGAMLLLAVVASVLRPRVKVNRAGEVVAGIASGILGTAAAVGSPPLALAYQDRPAAVLRATLALSFLVGSILSLLGLLLAQEVDWGHLLLALKLLPGIALGVWLSGYAIRYLDERWLWPAILSFAAAAALFAMISPFFR
jgi:uncharacterized membrane protein YfcA